ncbi:MAG: hypothetical protein FVQ80_03980 [Planctomycetes bacterium]|nr:hypothetical protein [Planctomycetota bacterium]
MESDYSCHIMNKSLNAERDIDGQTFTSLDILTERLEKVKSLGGIFAGIEFSMNVKKLAKKRSKVALC